jgi:hypothetical protein
MNKPAGIGEKKKKIQCRREFTKKVGDFSKTDRFQLQSMKELAIMQRS